MRVALVVIVLFAAGCSGQIQWGVPTEAKIQAQMAPLQEALQQHAQAINNQAKAIESLYDAPSVENSKQGQE